MKRNTLMVMSLLMPVMALAQTSADGLELASNSIGSYLPYVQSVCYALAGVVAIVGAIGVNMAYQTAPHEVKKRTMMTVGGAMCFVCMAIGLPQFFGMDGSDMASGTGSGSSNSVTVINKDGVLASNNGGVPNSGIKSDIPNLSNGSWTTFPNGSNMTTADFVMDIYNDNGNNYQRTIADIQNLYRTGQLSFSDYSKLMNYAQHLPH